MFNIMICIFLGILSIDAIINIYRKLKGEE